MSPIILLFDLRAETVLRVGDANQEAPDTADVKAIRVDENGLLVCGWMRLSSTRRLWWLSYPTGDAANIADAMLDCAKPGFFTADEIRAIEAAIKGARS